MWLLLAGWALGCLSCLAGYVIGRLFAREARLYERGRGFPYDRERLG